MTVTMTCMTTKKKFDVEDPDVIVLRNGRFAYRAVCPWEGKNGKTLTAFKFCSAKAHEEFTEKRAPAESELAESEHQEAEVA